ncbi:MAG TPA: pyridoxamine 5-phosphate oxidase [Nitrospinaceae bacterium]|jgi:predicted pyridoxine 5'-phosphate oxidase superfamily flavin-nucleotide-binding protein|nr:pyridoxamine 5-phosphate oxidase [Nitrospinaceae bacterium]
MANRGSKGEHSLQEKFGTKQSASAFYEKQMLSHLNSTMRDFISKQEMVFIASADSKGECDCSFRAGKSGFIRVLSEKTIAYPEYRGNGVMASLGNILENQNIGMTFIDFFESTIGLHVNGTAQIIEHEEFFKTINLDKNIEDKTRENEGKIPERWVFITVKEAYIHCSKHIPLLKKLDKEIHWGINKEVYKGGDFFKAKNSD